MTDADLAALRAAAASPRFRGLRRALLVGAVDEIDRSRTKVDDVAARCVSVEQKLAELRDDIAKATGA